MWDVAEISNLWLLQGFTPSAPTCTSSAPFCVLLYCPTLKCPVTWPSQLR